MKMTIRSGIFETNSSMTHSLVIGTKEDFQKWEAGELEWYHSWHDADRFVTKEEKEKLLSDDNSFAREFNFRTYKDFGSEMDCDGGSYTTSKGEDICWIAEFGYDG